MGLYQDQGRNRDGLSIEDGRHDLAAAPFYFAFIVQKALSACKTSSTMMILFPLMFPVML